MPLPTPRVRSAPKPVPYAYVRRALLGLPAALAALLCALAAPPVAADDGPGARTGWTVRPAGGGSDGRDARPYVYLEGTPAMVLQDRLSVTNSARTPLTVRLRGDGRAGSWLRFAADTVTVPARTRADVPFALAVPSGAGPGDVSGEAVAVGGGAEKRVPVRVRIGGPTLAALTVEDVEVSGRTIRYALVNRGNAVLRPRLAVRAEGVFGAILDRPERPLPLELAPGRRAELTEPWPDAPALDAVTVRLRVTADGGARDEGEASATYVPVLPAVGAGLAALGLLALLGTGAYRRRRTRRAPPGTTEGDGRQPTTEAAEAAEAAEAEEVEEAEAEQPAETRSLAKAGAQS
ncbi:hypothetical protein CIB93_13450 [Streptomyces sp. WZ.A104]|uniref:hypothetical protein n=1 Tax=Streptomyces sp. WZ.A104 TaxID=2023771 RepID=UPI000BBC3BEA|nr:hypothetical protein [Streptomyces sp. WZ.A104]PCG85553.1 hypothetical protein CIB93_13450 [Streptomyces sp. WZ.A104]